MELFDKTFWRMTIAFLCLILLGIGSVAVIGFLTAAAKENQAGFQDHL